MHLLFCVLEISSRLSFFLEVEQFLKFPESEREAEVENDKDSPDDGSSEQD